MAWREVVCKGEPPGYVHSADVICNEAETDVNLVLFAGRSWSCRLQTLPDSQCSLSNVNTQGIFNLMIIHMIVSCTTYCLSVIFDEPTGSIPHSTFVTGIMILRLIAVSRLSLIYITRGYFSSQSSHNQRTKNGIHRANITISNLTDASKKAIHFSPSANLRLLAIQSCSRYIVPCPLCHNCSFHSFDIDFRSNLYCYRSNA